jgi:CheY-like chemotaxis protein
MLTNKPVILCVDDEETPLKLRRLVLERAGYQVVTASSGPQALEIAHSHRIDLVLSDQIMPGFKGTELARQIKTLRPEVPFILLSGVNEVPPDADCADLFLSKLVGPRVLCETVEYVLVNTGKAELNS